MNSEDIPPASQIEDNLYLADFYNLYDESIFTEQKVSAALSLLDDPAPLFTRPEFRNHIPKDRHLFIKCSDTATQDLLQHFPACCDFIDRMLNGGQTVLLHCEEGVSRSPSALTAYLLRRDGKTVAETLEAVRSKRMVVDPSPNFLEQLDIWKGCGFELWEGEGRLRPKEAYKTWLEKKRR